MLGEMLQSEFVPRLVRLTGRVVQAVRNYRLIALILLVIAVAVVATSGLGRKVASWTAASTIVIGTIPSFNGIMNSANDAVGPVENARSLVLRIASPEFQSAVISGAQQELGSRSLVAQGAVRGIVLDDTTIRLEANASSKEVAVALLHSAVLAVQKAHQELLEPKLQLLREVREGLQAALNLLGESIKSGSLLAQAPAEQGAAGDVPSTGPRSQLDRLVNYRTRIAVLNYIERTLVPTAPQGGFAPAIDGPREANLVQWALITGLIMLFFAALLTFLLHTRSGRA